MTRKNIFILIIAMLATFTASAQCPGPAVRTALINLQRANVVNGTRWGQFGLTDTCGNQRYVTLDSLTTIITDSIAADTTLQRNWYTNNGTTTDLLRQALVKRSAWWRTVDSIGFIRWSNRPDNFNGPQFSMYQDSLVVDADTLIWKSSFNTPLQYHDLQAGGTYFHADSVQNVAIGQFPDFPNLQLDGTNKGFYYSPGYWGEVAMYGGDGTAGSVGAVSILDQDVSISSEYGLNLSDMNLESSLTSAKIDGTVRQSADIYGDLYFQMISNAGTGEESVGLAQLGSGPNVPASTYLGYGAPLSFATRYLGRAWGVRTQAGISFDWLQCLIPNDTTGNQVSMYNRAYYFPNDRPSSTLGDTSVIAWVGDGVNAGKNPIFVPLPSGGGGTNWYNSNGTTTDNTRIATVTETATWLSNDVVQDGVVPFRWELSGVGANEPENTVWMFPDGDSLLLLKLDQEITLHSSASYLHKADDILSMQADSIVFENNSVQDKTKARYIFAGTPGNNTIKRFDGDAANAGDIIVSNGTDWVVSSASSQGFLLNGGNTTGATVTAGTNDAQNLTLETSGVDRVTITGGATTGGAVTVTNVNANTNTVQDVLTLQTNSTGTAAANFGGGILFQGESSTTDNRDMMRMASVWSDATDASRTAVLVFSGVNSAGAIAECARLSAGGVLSIGTSSAAQYGRASITTATSFTVGNSSQALTLGGSTGAISVSNSNTSQDAIVIANSVNAATSTAGINIGNGLSATQTSGTRDYLRLTTGFAPTSGTAVHNSLVFSGTFNQTGGANGITRGIYLNQTLTAVADFRALEIAANNANAKGIYQTGSSTTNNFVGKTHFGATTAPTDAVDITGNLNLTTAGNKIKIATGSNASTGTATLVGGTVTVNTTAVTANSIIFLTCNTPGGTQGFLSAPVASITAGTSFVINSSSGTDTSTVNWWIIN